MSKIILSQYRIQVKHDRKSPWVTTMKGTEDMNLTKAKYFAAHTVDESIKWRIVKVKTTLEVVAVKPEPKARKKAGRVPMCKAWPNCACIVRGTVEDCRVI